MTLTHHDPTHYCAKCGIAHTSAYTYCDGLRGGWPPPVPTGFVPRRPDRLLTPEDEAEIRQRQADIRAAVELTALGAATSGFARVVKTPKPISLLKVIDDQLLMERKARAWDELRAGAEKMGAFGLLAQMDVLVHPAQGSST
jgi:hypothetical protein